MLDERGSVALKDVLGRFGEGSRADWVSAVSATFFSNTVLALDLWVDPLKNLYIKRGIDIAHAHLISAAVCVFAMHTCMYAYAW